MRVRVRPESKFYGQQINQAQGTDGVTVPNDALPTGWIGVRFENGYENNYPEEDLIYITVMIDPEFSLEEIGRAKECL